MEKPILEALGISKSFAGVKVLDDVVFRLGRGEVHALIGQNGAGKSTLMKIINGVYQRDSGVIRIDGKEVSLKDPLDARQAGISMVFQEFSLIPTMTVAQNVFLAREPKKNGVLIDDRQIERDTAELLTGIGVDVQISPREHVENLGVGARQLTEIAKALSQESRILILDEPTASLSSAEIESLFRVITRLKEQGIAIIYISHYLKDVFKICDSLTVLRDGRAVLASKTSETTIDRVINAMIGRKLDEKLGLREQPIDRSAAPLLQVSGLSTEHIQEVSFELWPNEVLGVAGLLGSGRSEIFRALFGIDRILAGEIKINNQLVRLRSTKDSLDNGIALIPEDRRSQGLILDFSVRENLLLPILRQLVRSLLIDDKRGRRIVSTFVKDFNIKVKSMDQEVKFLSGGNQQKVVVAKSMVSESKVLLLDDPTFGIDIKSKQEIMDIVRGFVNKGNGAVLVSSELGELSTYCDRVLVINKRRIAAIVDPREQALSEEELLKLVQ